MYDKFRQIIELKGISTYRVAKETKISQATFSDWKSGKSKPKVDKLVKIANYLGVKIEDLLE